jgi:hypothetical protein
VKLLLETTRGRDHLRDLNRKCEDDIKIDVSEKGMEM